MVSTRNHPREFPEPDLASPSKSSSSPRTPRATRRGRSGAAWAHTPSNAALLWLAVSLPLVIWDTGYVLLRPHSMPGGKYHWPLWTPYELYGRVDYIYGWPAFEAKNGFTSAQGALNTIETIMYFGYLWILYQYGHQAEGKGRGAPGPSKVGFLGKQRAVDGVWGAVAPLILYSASVMTLSKTVLYWLNEYFSGFDNIGHNKFIDLVYLWIIPNGAWLVLPTYMIYISGAEILQGLSIASGGAAPSSDDTALVKAE